MNRNFELRLQADGYVQHNFPSGQESGVRT